MGQEVRVRLAYMQIEMIDSYKLTLRVYLSEYKGKGSALDIEHSLMITSRSIKCRLGVRLDY